ncbi:unnamed protein product [Caenorhabditis brenneri]
MNSVVETSNSADIIFRNKIIVKKILNGLNIENQTFKHLKLRLISKTFDTELLSLIKKDFKKLEVDLKYDWDESITKISINKQLISPKEVNECYQFLRNLVNVEIESVHFTGDTDYSNTLDSHKLFMKSLILTNEKPVRILTSDVEFCSTSNEKECIPCRSAAPLCQEYGPMSLDVLLNAFTLPHHFDTLRISDFLLQKIGIESTRMAERKEECISKMKSMITSNITCDNLNLKLFVMDWNMGDCTNYQPREVIDEILEKWKVKNIKLKFVQNPYRNVSRPWRRPGKRFLKPFHFMMTPSSVETSEVSKVFVEHVVIDARWSEMEHRYKEHWEEPYLNLFSNLLRLFSTSEDIFVIRELKKDVALMFDDVLSNLVKYAWIGCPENNQSKLFIRLKYSDFVIHSEREEDIPEITGYYINNFQLSSASPEIELKFRNWRNVLEDYDPENIRQSFTLKNHFTEKELHFELVHTKKTLEMARQNLCTPFQILFYHQFFNF